LPKVLAEQEIADIINALDNIKHKCMLSLIYSAGLRRSELLNLKIKDIDSKRMLIKINAAKGMKDRIVPLSPRILDILREYYRQQDITNMLEEQTIEIAPLGFMRGRTFKDCFIIADEMQNATPDQVKMLMTRLGENSKIVITGDTEQTDRSKGNNGLADLCQKLKEGGVKGISLCEFDHRDIQRHHLITHILKMYE
jgi:phosphate starvation-inducible PhoH-like protein